MAVKKKIRPSATPVFSWPDSYDEQSGFLIGARLGNARTTAATARHGSFSCSRRHFIASVEMATDGAQVEIVGGEYRAKLGESPVWIDGELVFIDVVAREICVLRDGVEDVAEELFGRIRMKCAGVVGT